MKLLIGLIVGSSLGAGYLISPLVPICMVGAAIAVKIHNLRTGKEI